MIHFDKNILIKTTNGNSFNFSNVTIKENTDSLAVREGDNVFVFPYVNIEYFKVEGYA